MSHGDSVVLRITDKDTQTIIVTAIAVDHKETTSVFTLDDLVLEQPVLDPVELVAAPASQVAVIDGVQVDAMQEDTLDISEENVISGTLAYVSSYPGYSENPAEQEGNFLALEFAVTPNTAEISVVLTGNDPISAEDGVPIALRITDKDTQTITVTASHEGYEEVVEVFTLTGLVLTSQ